MSEPVLKIDSVALSYRKGRWLFSRDYKEVFRNISFSIYAGETLGIIGRNGAGKSSLLRLLAGIFEPDAGSITGSTESVKLLSHNLGFSEQLTGVQNIMLSGLYHGFAGKQVREKMDSIVALAGLENSIHDALITYSTGMRARLGFSIAYHLEPDILLIDEILGVGDVEFQYKSEALLKDKMKSNQTVVLVTHDEDLVYELCSRVIWIENGEILGEGLPEQIIPEYLRHMQVDIERGKQSGQASLRES